MKKSLFITLLFSILCLSVQSCSSCSPKKPSSTEETAKPVEEETAKPTEPDVQAPTETEIKPEQEKLTDDTQKETANPPQEPAKDLEWPIKAINVVDMPEIPDFSKYAFAIYIAMGCELESKPMEAFENDSIFNVHFLDDCNKDLRDDIVLKKLLEKKADINAYNAKGKTLLSMSLYHSGGDYEMTKESEVFDILLKNGADITKANDDGSTILMLTEFIETAEKYIAAGGDIHAKNKDGKTALDLQTQKLDKMENGEEIEGNHFDYFYEEASMGCQNDEDIEKAEKKGKKPPKCITYADIIKDNVRKIIQLIKTKGGV